MTTATKNHAAPAVAPTSNPPDIGLDNRLALAAIGLDVTMQAAAGTALAEANAEAAAAILEAQSTVDPTPKFEPHPVLQQAAELIRTRGWVQGVYEAPGGSLCAMAAIRESLYGPLWTYLPTDDRERGPVAELMRRIKADTGDGLSVPAWNDSRDGVDDVLRLLG